MSSGFEHLSPRIPVTFRVNSYSPIKLTLLRPEWTKTVDDLRLIVPEYKDSQPLLLAYKWYMKQFNDVCRPEPPPITHNRDVLRYLFVAGYTLSLDTLLSTVSDTEISRFGEHPDLTETELVAERNLLRLYVPDGTRVFARVSNTTQTGWIQDGRFMTRNSQMVHSSVFAFWAGMSAVANPHDVIWINKSPEICEPQTLTEYLKDAQKAEKKLKKSENEVVYPCAVADEYARLSAAVRTPWASPEGIAALAKLTSTSSAATSATSTIETLVTQIQFTPQQLLAKATARTAELQAELKLWRQIETQHKINKELEATLANLKATLV